MTEKFLTAQAVRDVQDIETRTVAVPEWGGSLRVRGLTGAQRDDFEEAMISRRAGKSEVNLRNFRARLVQRSVVDDKGKLMFSDGDVVMLGKKSAAALQRIYKVAEELAGISSEEVDELTKGFDDDQSEGSGSA